MIKTLGAASCAIFIVDPDDGNLQAQVVRGVFPPNTSVQKSIVSGRKHLQDYILQEKIKIGEGIIGKTAETKKIIWFQNPKDCEYFDQTIPSILDVKTAIYIPLMANRNFLGVMAAANCEDGSVFTENDVGLFKTLAEQGAISLENANLHIQVLANRLVQQDLEIAKEIQLKLIPKKLPDIPGLSIGGLYNSAKEVGGDYYDVIWDGKNRLGIIVADVSGKGVPGSLIMSMARSVMRAHIISSSSAADILKHTNQILYPDIPRGMFITACLAILDIKNRVIDISSAGHNPVAYYKHNKNEILWNWMEGLALGLDEGEMFNEIVTGRNIPVESGDMFFFYSDGVNEAFNEKREFFGYERMELVLKNYQTEDAPTFIEKLEREIKRFTGKAEQSDDITAVALKINL